MKSKNPLERIAKAAAKEGLKLRARISLCDGISLIERYPHSGCVNILGDSSTHRLCPSHPDVRQYSAAVVEDLFKNYPVEAVEISDWSFDKGRDQRDAYFRFGRATPDLNLLRWCFCSACRQRATDSGVEIETVRSEVMRWFEEEQRNGPQDPDGWPSYAYETPILRAYQRVLSTSGLQLLQLAAGPRAENVRGWSGPVIRGRSTGFSPSLIKSTAEGLVAELCDSTPGDRGICVAPARDSDGASLVAEVQQMRKDNVGAIVFENYGLCPEPCLNWVRQASRYAKREVGA